MAALVSPTPADRSRAADVLEMAIAEHWPQARIAEIDAVPGDASSRKYLRATLQADQPDDDLKLPDSLIVMLMEDAAIAMSSEELGVFGDGGPDELPFLNVARYLAKHTDALPAVYASATDSSALVLEDVGDVPLWDAARGAGGDRVGENLFAMALDTIAEIQARATDDASGCYAFSQAFDERLFGWEFEHFLEYGVADDTAAELTACRAELSAAAAALGALPRVFCHRDYHAWNIHVENGSRVRIIDFQDALLGPHVYDVASLLTDRSTPEFVDSRMEARLLAGYREALAKHADSSPYDGSDGATDLERDYALCALQRALKVIGRFNYLADVKGKTGYTRFLPSEIDTARRMIARLPNMPATASTLTDNVKGG